MYNPFMILILKPSKMALNNCHKLLFSNPYSDGFKDMGIRILDLTVNNFLTWISENLFISLLF